MKLPPERRVQAGFILAICLLIVASASMWWNGQRSARDFEALAAVHHIQALLNHANEAIVSAQTECRGFLITGDERHLESFARNNRKAQDLLADAQGHSVDDASRRERLAALARLIDEKIECMNEGVAIRRSGTPEEVRRFISSGRGQQLMQEIRATITELDRADEARLEQNFTATRKRTATVALVGLVSTIVALMLVAGAKLAIRRDRKRRQLAESERDQVFDLCPDILCVAGADGYVKRISPAVTEILGWTEEEIMAHPFLDFVHPGDRDEARREVERLVKTGARLQQYVDRCRHRDGGWRWISWNMVGQPGGRIFATGSDITDTRRSAEAQRRLAAIVESSQDAIISATPEGIVRSWNTAAERLFGYSAAEIIGQSIGMLVPPEGRDEQARILAAMERGEPARDIETTRLHRDGRSVEVSATISSLRDEQGRLVGAAAILRDISQRKAMEEALRRSEQSLAITLRSIGDAVLATDTESRITRMNPVAEKLTGWPEHEALGRPMREVLRIVHEHTRDAADPAIERVLATGQVHGLAADAVLIARDGTERSIADSAAPLRGEDGRILGVVLVFRDVTEERRAQEAIRDREQRLIALAGDLERRIEERTAALAEEHLRYHTLFEQSPIGVALFDPATQQFIDFNPAAHQQLGYTRHEFARLQIGDIEAGETPAEIQARMARLASSGADRFETKHRARNGELRDMVVSLRMIESGSRPVMYCLYEDITERRRAERLAQRAQRLESLGTLAGGIAHDLNNALAPISMGLEMLAMQCPQDGRTIELFRSSVKRGADMVRQLLTFAKGAEGERVVIAPKQLLTEMQAIVRATFPKNIAVEVRYPADMPGVVGDPTQLHQILLNLSVNARDAMPHGGLLVLEADSFEVDAVFAASIPEARPGKYVVLRVRDTGCGIPAELTDRIFEPFFTTKGPEKGTGLGLSTVMGIVRGHRGFLQVASEPGHGSTFAVFLPANLTPVEPVHAENGGQARCGQGQLILFVDDEAVLRDIARQVLRRLNFEVATARDGLDALMQATERRKELHAIITDLQMPHMDGLTFVRAMRRMLPEVPIAIATGRADDEKWRELNALGVTERLDKPFTEAQLASLLNTLLSRRPGR